MVHSCVVGGAVCSGSVLLASWRFLLAVVHSYTVLVYKLWNCRVSRIHLWRNSICVVYSRAQSGHVCWCMRVTVASQDCKCTLLIAVHMLNDDSVLHSCCVPNTYVSKLCGPSTCRPLVQPQLAPSPAMHLPSFWALLLL